MNYHLIIAASKSDYYDTCIKFLIHSAMKSDYIVEILSHKANTPVSPIYNEITLIGSSKRQFQRIVVDFDSLLNVKDRVICLSPDILTIETDVKATHYWGILGSLFKVISDISPAYVAGYLLENQMKDELALFTTYSNQLPFAVQVAITEIITDKD